MGLLFAAALAAILVLLSCIPPFGPSAAELWREGSRAGGWDGRSAAQSTAPRR